MTDTVGRVLVADDSRDLRECYRLWLEGSYDVVTAADGDRALDLLDDSIDVVILDREMPGTDGETVAEEITDGPFDPALLMISGVDPALELLDIPVDEYLTKPVSRDEVIEAIERVGVVARFRTELQSLFALTSRVATLEAHLDEETLAASEEYERLRSRLRDTRRTADEALDRAASTNTWEAAFESTVGDPEPVGVTRSSLGARQ